MEANGKNKPRKVAVKWLRWLSTSLLFKFKPISQAIGTTIITGKFSPSPRNMAIEWFANVPKMLMECCYRWRAQWIIVKGKTNKRGKKCKQVSIAIAICARKNENECTLYIVHHSCIWARIVMWTERSSFISFSSDFATHFMKSKCSIDPCRLKEYLTHFSLLSLMLQFIHECFTTFPHNIWA